MSNFEDEVGSRIIQIEDAIRGLTETMTKQGQALQRLLAKPTVKGPASVPHVSAPPVTLLDPVPDPADRYQEAYNRGYKDGLAVGRRIA